MRPNVTPGCYPCCTHLHRGCSRACIPQAAELGLVLSRLNEELTGENAELTAECERLRISTEETSHELVLARAAKIEVLQQVEDLQRDNLRWSLV